MAIKDMIADGIGFVPGAIRFILTRGLGAAVVTNQGLCPYRPGRTDLADSFRGRADQRDSFRKRTDECR